MLGLWMYVYEGGLWSTERDSNITVEFVKCIFKGKVNRCGAEKLAGTEKSKQLILKVLIKKKKGSCIYLLVLKQFDVEAVTQVYVQLRYTRGSGGCVSNLGDGLRTHTHTLQGCWSHNLWKQGPALRNVLEPSPTGSWQGSACWRQSFAPHSVYLP